LGFFALRQGFERPEPPTGGEAGSRG